jgi:predicted short-subunit dehydrogenase-like oxidoreductase (DUF2520 family)
VIVSANEASASHSIGSDPAELECVTVQGATSASFKGSAIGVIGAGRVGSALALALFERGYRIAAVASRRDNTARALARRIAGAEPVSAADVVARCDLVFVTTPDALVAGVAAEHTWRAGQAVVHTSGALDLSVLEPVVARDALPGSFHPLRAFAAGDPGGNPFAGITCGIAGPPSLAPRLTELAAALGARPLRIDGADRTLYHAAAVFSAGFGVALLAAARRVWALAGLPEAEARAALAPLLMAAAANAASQPLERALTGPIARGEPDTAERHLAKLEREPELAALYRALGAQLLELPLAIPPEVRAKLAQALRTR